MNKKRLKPLLQFVLLLGIGVAFIWFSFKDITEEEKTSIISALKSADYFWVGISLGVSFLSHFLRAWRWNLLLEPSGHSTKRLNALCHVLIGYFANYGIPRMGEISRCTLAAKYDKVPFEVGLGTVITERIVDLLLFFIIFLLTLFFQFQKLGALANEYVFEPMSKRFATLTHNPVLLVVLILVMVGGVIGLFMLRKKINNLLTGKIGGMIKGILDGLSSIMKLKRPGAFILMSLGIWLCYFYSLYICMLAIPGTANLGQSVALALLLFGTLGVMFSAGGLGAYPAILGGILMASYGVGKADAFALPWLSWTGQFALVVALGTISLIVLPLYNKNKKDELSQPTA